MSTNPFQMTGRRSAALADAAERLGRVANIVKDQQLARTRSGQRAPESEAYVASPEEAWSKKYMIQCIGPTCTIKPTAEGALLLPRFQPEPPLPSSTRMAIAAAAPPAFPERAASPAKPGRKRAGEAKIEPIGLAIGKPTRKRSLLARLFAS